MSKWGGGGSKCSICDKTAYPAETVQYEKKPYHHECFRCKECNKKMTPAIASLYEEDIFCTHCFSKLGFAQKQKKVVWTKKEGTGEVSKFGGGGTKCSVCEKTVYAAEQVNYEKKPYHPACLKCSVCDKQCTVSSVAQFEDTLYCVKCFESEGIRSKQAQVTRTSSSSTTNSIASKFGGGGTKCSVCEKTVYAAEQVNYEKKPYHPACLKCSVCDKQCTVSSVAQFEDTLYCVKCFESEGIRSKQAQVTRTSSSSTTNSIASKFGGGGTKCSVCEKTVYAAEQVNYEKKPYHPACLKCSVCDKQCTVSSVAQFEDTLYCVKCFESEGIRLKQAKVTRTSSSSTTNSIASKFGGGGTKCSVCEKTVYAAEQVNYEKKPYHPACLKCSVCDKQCTVSSVAQFEDTLYCVKCFESEGIRSKQAQVTRTTSSSGSTNSRFSKFGGGGTKCVRCAKTCYPAETISYEQNAFHQECFTCLNCCKQVTPSACEAKKLSDGGIDLYCKKCWLEGGHHRASVTPVQQ